MNNEIRKKVGRPRKNEVREEKEIEEPKKYIYKRFYYYLTNKNKASEADFLCAFDEYKEWCDDFPLMQNAQRGSMPMIVKRPLGLSSFCAYVGISKQEWTGLKTGRLNAICDLIEVEIRGENIDGALVKNYDPLTVAKIYGLADSTSVGGERAINLNIAVDGKTVGSVIGIDNDTKENGYGMEDE